MNAEEIGLITASMKAGTEGFHQQTDVMMNTSNETGTLTKIVIGIMYESPTDGT